MWFAKNTQHDKLGRVWTCCVLWMRVPAPLLLQLFCGCGFPLHCFAVRCLFSVYAMQHWLLISFWLSLVLTVALCAPFLFCNALPVLPWSSVQKALDAFSVGRMWDNLGKRWRMQALQCDARGRPAEAYGVHWMAYVVYRRTSLSIQLQCPCEACSCHASRWQGTASWWVPQQCWDPAPMRRENHRAALHDFGPGVLPGVGCE